MRPEVLQDLALNVSGSSLSTNFHSTFLSVWVEKNSNFFRLCMECAENWISGRFI